MSKMLIVLISGPDSIHKAKEGLSIALTIHRTQISESIRLLLVGTGVRCLDMNDGSCVEINEILESILKEGIRVSACTRSLVEYGLMDAAEKMEKLEPVSAPVLLASLADEGYSMITF